MKTIKRILILAAVLAFFFGVSAAGATTLFPSGGGTGISTTTAGNNGLCLKQLSNSPFSYTFAVCGSSGTATTSINGVAGPTFSFSVLGTNGLSYSTSSGAVILTQATSTDSVSGFLSAADHAIFNTKEPAITGGTSAQYWRGDKSFQTLNQAAVAGLTTSDAPSFSGISITNTTTTNLRISGITGGTKCLHVDTNGVVSGASGDCTTSSGITSLGGSTSSTQTFATGTDTNLGITISTLNGVHTLTPVWIGTLGDSRITSAATWNAKQNAITFPLGFASTTHVTIVANSPLSASTSNGTTTLTFSGTIPYASTTGVQNTLTFPLAFASTTHVTISGGTGISVSTVSGTSTITNTQPHVTSTIAAGGGTATGNSFIFATSTGGIYSILCGTATCTFTQTASSTWGLTPSARNINTTAPLGGGGNLTGDLTLTCTTCQLQASSTLGGIIGPWAIATTTNSEFKIATTTGTITFYYPKKLIDINNTATTTGNLLVGNGATFAGLAVGTNGKVLTASSTATNGVSWETIVSGATVAGSNTQIQFNNAGSLGADGNFIYTSSTKAFALNATSSNVLIGSTDGTTAISSNFYNVAVYTVSSTVTLSYTGATSSLAIPAGVGKIVITAKGAGGSSATNAGGAGGVATGTLIVSPGSTYYYAVGGSSGSASTTGGFGGGGFSGGNGAGGGGMSWLSGSPAFSTTTVLIVGSGGGGGGANGNSGGTGGGVTGTAGTGGTTQAQGGTQSAGGSSGSGAVCTPGTNGAAGQGAKATADGTSCGGGGGGGYYGGGEGGVFSGSVGSGAGGSSFLASSLTATSTAAGGGSAANTNGSITVTYYTVIYTNSLNSATAQPYALAVGGPIITGEPQNATTTVSACGTAPTFSGNMTAGTVTAGAGAASCTINFGRKYYQNPICVVSNTTSSVTNALGYLTTTSTLVITQTGLAGMPTNYICFGW